jgi:hypothetical protein
MLSLNERVRHNCASSLRILSTMDAPNIQCPKCQSPLPDGATTCPRCEWQHDQAADWLLSAHGATEPPVQKNSRKATVMGFLYGFAVTFGPFTFAVTCFVHHVSNPGLALGPVAALLIVPVVYSPIPKQAMAIRQGFRAGSICGVVGLIIVGIIFVSLTLPGHVSGPRHD